MMFGIPPAFVSSNPTPFVSSIPTPFVSSEVEIRAAHIAVAARFSTSLEANGVHLAGRMPHAL